MRKILFALLLAALVVPFAYSAVASPANNLLSDKFKQLHQKKFKPAAIRPRLTVPSRSAVREVGGFQYGRHVDIKLKDGFTVRCYPTATSDPAVTSKNYYYLPTHPHVARHPDGMPKFSMIRFVTNKTKQAGGAEGAILHFLVEYGLTKAQQQELAKALAKKVNGAELKGAVPLEVGAEGNSFSVVSATLTDAEFTSTLVTSGKAPVMEGQQVAVAARLDAYGATLLGKSLQQPTTDISVVFDLKYVVKLPAYDVKVTINYDKYHEIEREYSESKDKKTRRKRYWNPKWYNPLNISTRKSVVLTEEERTRMLDFLKETGLVTFEYVQHVPDADKEIVESGLHKIVLESFFDMQNRLGEPTEEELMGGEAPEEDEASAAERKKRAAKVNHYRYTVFQRKEIKRKSRQTLNLKKIMARYEQHTMTGNVGAWYAEYKDDPNLVTEVNLDDPFFQRREMRFVIDNEAYDIFNEMVNYATVQVRVSRKGQRPFLDELTIDKKYLEENGQTATLTYARMGDDAQTYEYAAQWSLRGGHLYPRKPEWQKGDMMAVTLAAPVTPEVVEAEADIDDLDSLGFARVAVELRYKRFGKDYIDKRALAISISAGEPLDNTVIYRDADAGEVEYRLIYYHKKMGKISDKSWKRVEGGYIYCAPAETVLENITAR